MRILQQMQEKARELGAEGIGLLPYRAYVFEGNRIDAFREMICSETVEEKRSSSGEDLT